MRWLLVLFVIMPITELYILIYLSNFIGFWYTLLSVIFIGALGFYLAHSQGFLLFGYVRKELARGRIPGNEILDALIVSVSGLLLITPGLITDILGIMLLVPLLRVRVRNLMKQWLWQLIKLRSDSIQFWRL